MDQPHIQAMVAVDTKSGKWLWRKHTVVNVAFIESIPGIMISTGNVKWTNEVQDC